jgi:hypothetical protein
MVTDKPATSERAQARLHALQELERAMALIDRARALSSVEQRDQLASVMSELECALDLLKKSVAEDLRG